ncbi:hypothetical protein HOK51_01625 [Candidatus Woesearchaeota archaeon]|jgi:hypothetical protein|nr:hypothetical protein [Candidatus Woesearchaeota archaeon]MBT6518514.1 hypothetical protein [Candidatus Woesearchaeota archaeon]MBT7368667.1 hypothetical protein [Candidatus Woesearchaeota archaeon]
MGSQGHLELILKDGTLRKTEVYFDGPDYVANVLQDLARFAGGENKSITKLDLDPWFEKIMFRKDSKEINTYDAESANYCRINQQTGRIDVDSGYVCDEDENNLSKRIIDLENPHNNYGFNYDPQELKAALKILGCRDNVFWKDEDNQTFYSDTIDEEVPFKVQKGEYLLVSSIDNKKTLFEFDGTKFIEKKVNV